MLTLLAAGFFGQTFEPHDLITVGILIVLEGVLSIDNALVLGLLARRLPEHLQKRALTYGLVGAFAFRIVAISLATFLLEWHIMKLIGGAYLLYIAIKHFVSHDGNDSDEASAPDGNGASPPTKYAAFWPTVLVIELTDIAFAIDSILAAIGLVSDASTAHVGQHPKLWVVIIGGMLGVILMRFAAILFIKLLEKFPRFETAAYLLVILIGSKLVAEYLFKWNFHNVSGAPFWIFWTGMLGCFLVGFMPGTRKQSE